MEMRKLEVAEVCYFELKKLKLEGDFRFTSNSFAATVASWKESWK